MDAYDIFKKLTKGLTFKHRVLGVKQDAATPNIAKTKREEIEIKEELPSDDDESLNRVDQPESGSESDSSGSDISSHKDGDLQLVKGIKVGEKKRKKKNKEKSEELKKKLELEEHNRIRNEHGIKAVGRHIPAALGEFLDLVPRYHVSQTLVAAITHCGYTEPTPVQRQAMPCMLEDRQILACAPTGSGKTAAFLLPIIHSLGAPQGGPRALVLCPTRELAHQIYQEALRLSVGTELRVSVLRAVKESKIKEREATIKKSDVLISTPNRLCYLLNQDSVAITLEKIRWLVIDEADKMFEGSTEEQSTFRQQLEQVMTASENKQRRVAMFSATHTPAVAKWSRHHLRGLINITVGQRNAATNLVDQELLYCGNENGKLIAFRQLIQKGLKPPVLVFVQSKDRARQLFKELIYDGINVDAIHADRTQAQRDNAVRSFRVGRTWVLICTELMGRGMDFRGVNLVVNYDFPPNAISYVHRVGRAGRAGQRGEAITFFTQDDVANLRSIASVMKQSGCSVPEYMLQLKQNSARRKARRSKAPRREHISTKLERPAKRKLDETSNKDTDKTQNTEVIKTGKHNKHRKIQNGVAKVHKKKQDGGQKKTNYKKNKKNLKKKKSNVLVKKVKNKS